MPADGCGGCCLRCQRTRRRAPCRTGSIVVAADFVRMDFMLRPGQGLGKRGGQVSPGVPTAGQRSPGPVPSPAACGRRGLRRTGPLRSHQDAVLAEPRALGEADDVDQSHIDGSWGRARRKPTSFRVAPSGTTSTACGDLLSLIAARSPRSSTQLPVSPDREDLRHMLTPLQECCAPTPCLQARTEQSYRAGRPGRDKSRRSRRAGTGSRSWLPRSQQGWCSRTP